MDKYTAQIARFMGPTWGPTGPRWALCWPHELCYLGICVIEVLYTNQWTLVYMAKVDMYSAYRIIFFARRTTGWTSVNASRTLEKDSTVWSYIVWLGRHGLYWHGFVFWSKFCDNYNSIDIGIFKFYTKSTKCGSLRFDGHASRCHRKTWVGVLIAIEGQICVHYVGILLRRTVRPSPLWWMQISRRQISAMPSATTIWSLLRLHTIVIRIIHIT